MLFLKRSFLKRLPNYLALFLKKRLDNPIAMWYDKRLASVGARGFDFVKSLAVVASDV